MTAPDETPNDYPWDFIRDACESADEQILAAELHAPVGMLLHLAAADGAVRFAELVQRGVTESFAVLSVTLEPQFGAAFEAAAVISELSYEEWRAGLSAVRAGRRLDAADNYGA